MDRGSKAGGHTNAKGLPGGHTPLPANGKVEVKVEFGEKQHGKRRHVRPQPVLRVPHEGLEVAMRQKWRSDFRIATHSHNLTFETRSGHADVGLGGRAKGDVVLQSPLQEGTAQRAPLSRMKALGGKNV
jgi:hypothetical protein